ncbi:hypothetical protein GCM10009753_62620 [Streptantibioticus ferralitis]
MATARRGDGAYVNGERVRLAPMAPSGTPRVTTSLTSGGEARRRQLDRLTRAGIRTRTCTAVGVPYPQLARGEPDGLVCTWEAPWDHAAGVLLVGEAGGTNPTPTGAPFQISGGNALPFATARDDTTARRLIALLAEE